MLRNKPFQETPIYDELVLQRPGLWATEQVQRNFDRERVLQRGLKRLQAEIDALPAADELAERREQKSVENMLDKVGEMNAAVDAAIQRHPVGKQRGPNGRFVRTVKDQPQA